MSLKSGYLRSTESKNMEEPEQPRSRHSRGGINPLWWVAAFAIGVYFFSKSGLVTPSVLLGPTVIPDPLTSVQAGGQGSSVQSLSYLSMFGPYANG